ncbi:hypothetical protein GQ457_02G014470 [Hibiscus cannabinus]
MKIKPLKYRIKDKTPSSPGTISVPSHSHLCFAFSFSAIRALVEPERQLSDLSYGNDGSGHTLQLFASTGPYHVEENVVCNVLRLNQLLYWNGTQMASQFESPVKESRLKNSSKSSPRM